MKLTLEDDGVEIIDGVYAQAELSRILESIESEGIQNKFGIREFLSNNTKIAKLVFTNGLIKLIDKISPNCSKSIKSIYFDKPPHSNWVVNWHQDLTINLNNRAETINYKNWRETNNRIVVQPDRELLESIFTIRIHLDNCTKDNGALRVIRKSHKNGVIQINDWLRHKEGEEVICEVERGGVLLMKPLLLHSSRRTENDKKRRVIHIEFTNQELPNDLKWKEKIKFR